MRRNRELNACATVVPIVSLFEQMCIVIVHSTVNRIRCTAATTTRSRNFDLHFAIPQFTLLVVFPFLYDLIDSITITTIDNNRKMADPSIVKPTTAQSSWPSSTSKYLKLQFVGQQDKALVFYCQKSALFQRLKIAYSSRIGVSLDELRFFFEGRRIDDEDTPLSLELDDMDIITVLQEQTGGGGGGI